jgi:hypothetical protein
LEKTLTPKTTLPRIPMTMTTNGQVSRDRGVLPQAEMAKQAAVTMSDDSITSVRRRACHGQK